MSILSRSGYAVSERAVMKRLTKLPPSPVSGRKGIGDEAVARSEFPAKSLSPPKMQWEGLHGSWPCILAARCSFLQRYGAGPLSFVEPLL